MPTNLSPEDMDILIAQIHVAVEAMLEARAEAVVERVMKDCLSKHLKDTVDALTRALAMLTVR